MVGVTSKLTAGASETGIEIDNWLESVSPGRSREEMDVLHRAFRYAQEAHTGQTRVSGEPYIRHLFAAASILAEMRMDHETLAATILHDVVEDTSVTLDDIRRDFGTNIATLVDGVTKLAVIPEVSTRPEKGRREHIQAESLRKMLLAMAEDVRVVLIKLADRLHNMRTLGVLSEEKQSRIARETMDIFAPLANRLGIWQLKWELEDLSFRYLEPDAYKQIAEQLAEKRADRERYLEHFVEALSKELKQTGIQADISARPKHIFGIWRKMQRKHQDFEQITDIRGVRVLVDSVRDCYAALGVVHSLWPHVPGEFDDYIATPKENNYRSIHTAVIGPEGKVVEVQIRTHEMHRQSEYGVAAHWRYKEGVRRDESFDNKIAWLRTLLEWKDEVAEASDFVDQFKSEVFTERVYVFTPQGKVIDLPAGATPVDFAYHVHTEVGHRCRGAKVNGHIVPLTYVLKTGEQVEILTVKEGGPSRDWLSPHLGYLLTSKARYKVSHWFKLQNYEASVSAGRDVLERELHRLGIVDVKYETLMHKFNYPKVDDFFAAIGRGDVRPAQIVAAVQELFEPRQKVIPVKLAARPQAPSKAAAGVTILGVGNLLTRMGKCCNPLPGDPIVGFITRGQGITIHRRDCHNALRHHADHGERLIEVGWGPETGGTYPVDVEITAYERGGLLRDITSLLANEKINVIGVSTLTDKAANVAHMTFTVEIPDLDVLSRVLTMIDQIPNVSEVRRKAH